MSGTSDDTHTLGNWYRTVMNTYNINGEPQAKTATLHISSEGSRNYTLSNRPATLADRWRSAAAAGRQQTNLGPAWPLLPPQLSRLRGGRGRGGGSAILQQRQRADGPALLLSSVHRVFPVPSRPQWAGQHRQRWRGGRPYARRLIPGQPVQQHVCGLLGAAWPAERGGRRHRRGRGVVQAPPAGVRAVPTATAAAGRAKKKRGIMSRVQRVSGVYYAQ